MSELGGVKKQVGDHDTKLLRIISIAVIAGLLFCVGIDIVVDELVQPESPLIDAIYGAMLIDIYQYYLVAMRDMEAANDLIKANYYAQYLDYEYRTRWILERPSPRFYADDAMRQLDKALKILTETSWPDNFKDDVSQLQTYISELRQLALKMQEIANKNVYTRDDVERSQAILDSFHSYNDKIFNIIKNAP